jgi:hypothetical protein
VIQGVVLASALLVLSPTNAQAHHGGVCWASSRDVGYANSGQDIYAQWAMSCHRQVYRIRMYHWVFECGQFSSPKCYSGQLVGGTSLYTWDERFNTSFFSKRKIVSQNFSGYRWYCPNSYAVIELAKGGSVEKVYAAGELAYCEKL